MDSNNKKTLIAGLVVVLAVLAAYSNHFQNDFHFDDSHTIVDNVYIQDIRNIPGFFTDAHFFSTLPDHQVYQPVTAATLAVDYWLAGGLKPFYFHLSTFVWLLVMLGLLFFVFRRTLDVSDPHPSNTLFAVLAVAIFGLHPAIAETVNYIIQRADVLSTLGVVASLFLYIQFSSSRKWGWYMAPAAIGMLAKAPALIFPVILLVYVFLFQQDGSLGWSDWVENGKKWLAALKATFPAFAVTIVTSVLIWAMTPKTFTPGAASAALYRITQPYVALRYFKSFFFPTELSADTDWTVVSGLFSTEAVIGFLFVVALLWLAVWTSKAKARRPIAFGIIWFVLALFPTSITALAEVTNDHRMFFPFIGLALAAAWTVRLVLFQKTERLTSHPNLPRVTAVLAICILGIAALGVRQRNQVWRTDESLWKDVTIKSPKDGRGLMNYGLTQMEKGDYSKALEYFQRALEYTPNYSLLEINIGIANGGLNRDAEAETHFQRALSLAPDRAESHYFYGRWLKEKGRVRESIAQLEAGLRANPNAYDDRHLLMRIYSEQGDWGNLQRVAQDTLRLAPNDATAKAFISARENRDQEIAAAEREVRQSPTPEGLLGLSLLYYQSGRYSDCIQTAQRALQLKPDYAEAYNNMAAGYNSLQLWDDGIRAANEAIRLKPDFELAKNNLVYALTMKQNGRMPVLPAAPAATASPAPTAAVPKQASASAAGGAAPALERK